jgi:hypothetical protein
VSFDPGGCLDVDPDFLGSEVRDPVVRVVIKVLQAECESGASERMRPSILTEGRNRTIDRRHYAAQASSKLRPKAAKTRAISQAPILRWVNCIAHESELGGVRPGA